MQDSTLGEHISCKDAIMLFTLTLLLLGTTLPSSKEASLTTGLYDRSQAQMQALRSNPKTYCSAPEGWLPPLLYNLTRSQTVCVCVCVFLTGKSGDFLQWCSSFDLAQHQEEISLLLVEASEIRQFHSELVCFCHDVIVG